MAGQDKSEMRLTDTIAFRYRPSHRYAYFAPYNGPENLVSLILFFFSVISIFISIFALKDQGAHGNSL